MAAAVCTLFEGNYHFGVAALVNSLVESGFVGTVYAGFRGELPPWAAGKVSASGRFAVTNAVEIAFIPLDSSSHLSSCKPGFLVEVATKHAPDAACVFFFDPDVLIYCRWSFFEQWVRGGVALCADVNWQMPNDHPFRNLWRDHFRQLQIELPHMRDVYYNAGFIGVSRECVQFLEDWRNLHATIQGRHDIFMDPDRTSLFAIPDQDMLNAATMLSPLPLSTMGLDGMDLRRGSSGFIMGHALGVPKPWNQCFTVEVLRGRAMSRPCRRFVDAVNGAIRPFAAHRILTMRFDALVARILRRVFA